MDLDKIELLYGKDKDVKQILDFAKKRCIKCIKDTPEKEFKKGLYYEFDNGEAGTYICQNVESYAAIDVYSDKWFDKVEIYFDYPFVF